MSDKKVAFAGRIVMPGCGSIGQGVLPLPFKHLEADRARRDCRGRRWRGDVAASCGVAPEQDLLTRENHREAVGKRLQKGDVLPTLSVEVASLSSIALAQSLGITDPEDGPSCAVPELCGPCLRPAVGACSDRTPLSWREKLFPEDLDREDPDRQDIWQFMNVRVLQGGDPPATWAGWNLSERT